MQATLLCDPYDPADLMGLEVAVADRDAVEGACHDITDMKTITYMHNSLIFCSLYGYI